MASFASLCIVVTSQEVESQLYFAKSVETAKVFEGVWVVPVSVLATDLLMTF